MTKNEFVERVLKDQEQRKKAEVKKKIEAEKDYSSYLIEASNRVRAFRRKPKISR